jgi:hypothetical protein
MAIDKGIMGSKSNNKMGISEGEINDLKLKYTKESTWGEILKVCRDQLTQSTFDKIVNDLIHIMRSSHDSLTKSTAVQFVNDLILENKKDIISA